MVIEPDVPVAPALGVHGSVKAGGEDVLAVLAVLIGSVILRLLADRNDRVFGADGLDKRLIVAGIPAMMGCREEACF